MFPQWNYKYFSGRTADGPRPHGGCGGLQDSGATVLAEAIRDGCHLLTLDKESIARAQEVINSKGNIMDAKYSI